MKITSPNSLDLVFAVESARRERAPNGPFPAARDTIFGTAFAISDDLFLTAGHVVEAAASVGDVALGRLGYPVEDSRYDIVEDWEMFEGVDLALIKCAGFNPPVYQVLFEKLPIFDQIRALGFGLGLDPEYYSYAPRGFVGHVVAGLQLFQWKGQPLAYKLSFVPPKGLSGAALVPDGFGPLVAAGIVVGTQSAQIEGETTRLGIAIVAEELLRLHSRIVGGPLAGFFGREQLPARNLILPVSQRRAEMQAQDDWPEP